MATFQVPQFIDIEDKIIGPLTLRQFIILISTVAVIFLINRIFEFWLVIILGSVIGGLGLALAFLKVNGQYFSKVAFNAVKYFINPRLYVWQRTKKSKNLLNKPRTIVKKEKETKRLNLRDLEEFAKKLDE